MNARDKLLPCTCGGNGITIDVEPPAIVEMEITIKDETD